MIDFDDIAYILHNYYYIFLVLVSIIIKLGIFLVKFVYKRFVRIAREYTCKDIYLILLFVGYLVALIYFEMIIQRIIFYGYLLIKYPDYFKEIGKLVQRICKKLDFL